MSSLKEFNPLDEPFIKVEAEVVQNALINGQKTKIKNRIPSGKTLKRYYNKYHLQKSMMIIHH